MENSKELTFLYFFYGKPVRFVIAIRKREVVALVYYGVLEYYYEMHLFFLSIAPYVRIYETHIHKNDKKNNKFLSLKKLQFTTQMNAMNHLRKNNSLSSFPVSKNIETSESNIVKKI